MGFWFLNPKNLTCCLALNSNNKIASSGIFDRIALVFRFFTFPFLQIE